ncbi:MAG TPA: M23 family metallopeptidase, partial [Caulobacter sp.]|nr:M23 family metallopeptidase [Caulobacter sp.]
GKPAARLPGVPLLQPGEGLLVTSQVFSWTGQRDGLRISASAATPGAARAGLTVPVVTAQPEPRYEFPLKGRFYIQSGPSLNTHHRWAVPEEFALDIAEIGEGGLSYRRDGATFIDYLAYGQPVYAAADGEVVNESVTRALAVLNYDQLAEVQRRVDLNAAEADRWMLAAGTDALAGNVVVIRHPWGEYSVYAHLKPDSLVVKVGQKVSAGEMIARLGSSGSSTEPHLHFHVCDGPSALMCVGQPVSFRNIENPYAFTAGAIQSGDIIVAR